MATCPYCKAEMDDPPIIQKLTFKQYVVYQHILSAGQTGCPISMLMSSFFVDRSNNTLRSCINNINRAIRPMKIRAHGGSYYLQG